MRFKIWLETTALKRTLYHGTAGEVDQFDLSSAGERDYGDFGLGIYLSFSPTLAISYAYAAAKRRNLEPIILVVEHNLKNPAPFSNKEFLQKIIDETGIPFPKKITAGQKQSRPKEESIAITKYITNLGYDCGMTHSEIVVYDPNNLKIIERRSVEDAQFLS